FCLCFSAVLRTQFNVKQRGSVNNTHSSCGIPVMAQTENLTGIFMLIDGGTYTLNFTEASAACLFLNVTIATKAQMEDALQHGLEICKYGWVAEKIAVVPRIKADNNCGAGKTGLVTWNASADRPFAAFCFNASGTEQSPTQSPPLGEKPATPGPAKQAPSPSPPLTGTTDSSSSSSSSSSLPSHIPVSPHLLITSIPIAVTSGFSTSTQSPVSLEPGQQPSVSSSNLLLDGKHYFVSLDFTGFTVTGMQIICCIKKMTTEMKRKNTEPGRAHFK
uniref:Link domain-containing protein n=1 Tax=Fundulus heteroclitus TaxID=8078 RepID=A0A3Q2QKL1_FUNHE